MIISCANDQILSVRVSLWCVFRLRLTSGIRLFVSLFHRSVASPISLLLYETTYYSCLTFNWILFPVTSIELIICFSGRMGDGPLCSRRVTDYLKANRGFLEHHVLEHVDSETLERWYLQRVQKEKALNQSSKHSDEKTSRKISISRWKVIHTLYRLIVAV